MKYVVILGDGMADYPVDLFDIKTILEGIDDLQSTIWHKMARWV